ncbi:unnamed protein product [Boreogadus saida]
MWAEWTPPPCGLSAAASIAAFTPKRTKSQFRAGARASSKQVPDLSQGTCGLRLRAAVRCTEWEGLTQALPTTGAKDCIDMAENLNQFYCRFEKLDHTQEREKLMEELTARIPGYVNRELQQAEVELVLRRIRPNEAPGPDQICGHLLKACSNQLAGVYFRHVVSN